MAIRLFLAMQMGIRKLRVQGDQKLVIQQVNGEIALKENGLARIRSLFKGLSNLSRAINSSTSFHRTEKHVDALATLASKVDIHDETVGVKFIRKNLQLT